MRIDVDHLLQSWDRLHAVDPKNIFLATRNGVMQFEQKRARSLWEKIIIFIFGECSNESFRTQVAKITELFESNKLAIGENERKLIDRMNILGRYVFKRRLDKTFFLSPKPQLKNFQIRTSSQEDTLIAPDLIKRVLPNPSKKRCWLNSCLKYFAATPFYDKLLTTKLHDPELEILRSALFRIVDGLRKNWSQTVIDALLAELTQAIAQSPFYTFLSGQRDAEEFIQQLENNFQTTNREEIHCVKLYRSFDKNISKPGKVDTIDKLRIIPSHDIRFSIEDSYMAESEIEGVREYRKGRAILENAPPITFYSHERVTHYPHLFEVSIKRAHDFDAHDNNGFMTQAEIALDPHATITLTEFTLDAKAVKTKATHFLTCKVIAAIERTGITSQDGHYITHIRSQDDFITTHNDGEIIENQPPQVFATASSLILQIIARDPISPQ